MPKQKKGECAGDVATLTLNNLLLTARKLRGEWKLKSFICVLAINLFLEEGSA
jgi:hypothetical protein